MTQIKSINVNSIFDKKTTKQNLNKPLCRIAGQANDFINVAGKFGESTGFKGDFIAVNLLSGEVFESNVAFIPSQLTNTVKEKLSSGESIFLEFDLMATESEKSPTGYAWIANEPMTEKRKKLQDELREKAEQIKSMLALPAPKKTK